MEGWQIMAGLTGMLLIYAVLATVFDYGTTPIDLVIAIVFGAIGLYVGQLLSDRLFEDEE